MTVGFLFVHRLNKEIFQQINFCVNKKHNRIYYIVLFHPTCRHKPTADLFALVSNKTSGVILVTSATKVWFKFAAFFLNLIQHRSLTLLKPLLWQF